MLDPAVIIILLIFLSGLGTAYFSGTVGVDQCKVDFLAEKKRKTAEKIKAHQKKTEALEMFQTAPGTGADSEPEVESPAEDKGGRTGTENFNNLFSTDNLEGQAGTEEESERKGTENFNNLFSPDNLEGQVESEN